MDLIEFSASGDIEAALDGDFAPLIERLRGDEPIRRPEREFLADYLAGNIKRKRGKKPIISQLDVEIFIAYEWLIGKKQFTEDSTQFELSVLIKETEKTIRNRVKRARKLSPGMLRTIQQFAEITPQDPWIFSATQAEIEAAKIQKFAKPKRERVFK
jgi:hypothetical protein